MKMNGMMMKMMRGQLAKSMAFKDACTEVTLVGEEKVTVPAGSFKAKHFHSAKYETDSWVDLKVPFSMVKIGGQERTRWCWWRAGDGAKSVDYRNTQGDAGNGQGEVAD